MTEEDAADLQFPKGMYTCFDYIVCKPAGMYRANLTSQLL